MRDLLMSAAERAINYLETLDQRPVVPSREAIAGLALLDESLPEGPTQPDEVVRILDAVVSPATMAMAGSRFYGFVIGGSLPVTLAANWLAGAWDQNSAFYNVTPGTAFLEQVALAWLIQLFKLPQETGGAFVTGATMANFSALAAARHSVLDRAGWNVEADGLFGAPPITIVVGEEAHPTLFKSLGLLGLGRNRVVRVPVDSQGRMRVDALPGLDELSVVCTQAGNVNTGAFDPIAEICQAAHAAGAWVHVDGAFGLWASAVPSLAYLSDGINAADSWATDFHKWLNVPYDSGLALVRDANALQAAMAVTADYLPTLTSLRNPSDFTPELSRRARGVEVWAALRSLGRRGVIELVERTCRYARRLAGGLQSADYAILNDVVLNQVVVSFGDAETTLRVVSALQEEGTSWFGSTVWQGQTAMRISVSSWATKDDDVDLTLDTILRIARLNASP
jgi:glutamate/tyrosine decarboxylase-like PLP-dependent enzyme